MSDNKFLIRNNALLKDAMFLLGWITAILIIAGLCWSLTQSIRNRFLMRAVNNVLEQSGDARRLTEPAHMERSGSLHGTWYTMTIARQADGSKALVFSFIGEGTFFPCAAVVNSEGKVQEFIPLNSHGKRIIARMAPGVLNLYARRIEGSEL